jgi:hypothetical protein
MNCEVMDIPLEQFSVHRMKDEFCKNISSINAVYEIIRKYAVQPERPQTAI